jgi:hypothetical protein
MSSNCGLSGLESRPADLPSSEQVERPPLLFGDKPVNVFPRVCTGSRQVPVRGVAEYNRWVSVGPELFNVRRRVLDVEICSDSGFVCKEAQIPIWDVVAIEPSR